MLAERFKKVAILPAGQWGSALAIPLSKNGVETVLYLRSQEGVERFNATHRHIDHSKQVKFPSSVTATNNIEEALDKCSLAIVACPSDKLREFYPTIMPHLDREIPVLSVIKGLEAGTNFRMSQVITDLDPDRKEMLAVLSGPNLAKEVAKRRPVATTIASESDWVSKSIQKTIGTGFFRAYTSRDVIGVELGGALKNVIAIATGIGDGMRMGSSAKASLATRGLDEICHLGVGLGAKVRTFMGLPGVGDFMLTCGGPQSRNYKFGRAIGRGSDPRELLALGETIEGSRTVGPALELAKKVRVEAPVMQEVYEVIYNGKSPRKALKDLTERELTVEHRNILII